MSYKMSEENRKKHLADPHIAIMSVNRKKKAPLATPVWYLHTDNDEFIVSTIADSMKWRLLEKEMRFTLTIQLDKPPYWYISASGPIVEVTPTDDEKEGKVLAHRYLGKEEGDKYLEETVDQKSFTIRMKPDQWLTADYG